jgi:hypothetical protein
MMNKWFGPNWRTGVSGYIESALIFAATTIYEGGIPHEPVGWVLLAVGTMRAVTAFHTKDKQVTHLTGPTPPGIVK